MTFKNVFSLIKETYKEWTKDHASRLAAALAYYTIFSLAPLLVIVIAIAGFFFGREAITGEVVRQIGGMIAGSFSSSPYRTARLRLTSHRSAMNPRRLRHGCVSRLIAHMSTSWATWSHRISGSRGHLAPYGLPMAICSTISATAMGILASGRNGSTLRQNNPKALLMLCTIFIERRRHRRVSAARGRFSLGPATN